MYGGISEPGMVIYLPRVRRDRGVPPRGISRRASSSPWLTEGGRGNPLGQWDWGSESVGMKIICLLYSSTVGTTVVSADKKKTSVRPSVLNLVHLRRDSRHTFNLLALLIPGG